MWQSLRISLWLWLVPTWLKKVPYYWGMSRVDARKTTGLTDCSLHLHEHIHHVDNPRQWLTREKGIFLPEDNPHTLGTDICRYAHCLTNPWMCKKLAQEFPITTQPEARQLLFLKISSSPKSLCQALSTRLHLPMSVSSLTINTSGSAQTASDSFRPNAP